MRIINDAELRELEEEEEEEETRLAAAEAANLEAPDAPVEPAVFKYWVPKKQAHVVKKNMREPLRFFPVRLDTNIRKTERSYYTAD